MTVRASGLASRLRAVLSFGSPAATVRRPVPAGWDANGEWFIEWPPASNRGSRWDGRAASPGDSIEAAPGTTFRLADCPERTRGDWEHLFSGLILRVGEVSRIQPAPSASPHEAECAAFLVVEVVPGWRACGTYAEGLPALLRSFADLTPERLSVIADRLRQEEGHGVGGGWPERFVRGDDWPERFVWGAHLAGHPLGKGDPRLDRARGVTRWMHLSLLRAAPEWALDPWDLERNKGTLADPGWVRLHMAALGAALALMFPDVPEIADRDGVDRWRRASEDPS